MIVIKLNKPPDTALNRKVLVKNTPPISLSPINHMYERNPRRYRPQIPLVIIAP